MEHVDSFGGWVKRRRRALRLTQAELADRVGVSAVLVRKIEAGDRRPSIQVAALLARHLLLPGDARDIFIGSGRGQLTASLLPHPTEGLAPAALDVS